MKFQPLKYGVITVLKYNFIKGRKYKRDYTFILRSFLILKRTLFLKRDYDLKNILYSERTKIIEGLCS